MHIVFPANHSTWFSLIHNGYRCTNGDHKKYQTNIKVNLNNKTFHWTQYLVDPTSRGNYFDKCPIDGVLLRRATMLATLGIPENEMNNALEEIE